VPLQCGQYILRHVPVDLTATGRRLVALSRSGHPWSPPDLPCQIRRSNEMEVPALEYTAPADGAATNMPRPMRRVMGPSSSSAQRLRRNVFRKSSHCSPSSRSAGTCWPGPRAVLDVADNCHP